MVRYKRGFYLALKPLKKMTNPEDAGNCNKRHRISSNARFVDIRRTHANSTNDTGAAATCRRPISTVSTISPLDIIRNSNSFLINTPYRSAIPTCSMPRDPILDVDRDYGRASYTSRTITFRKISTLFGNLTLISPKKRHRRSLEARSIS